MDEKNYINPDSPVYISYAWGEDLEIDINKLCELMDANGILFKRDKAKGDNSLCPYRYNIIDAEEEIGKGKAIIVVLSDKYIKSLNCMYEWHCICKTGNIAQRVFPIVLPGTKLRLDWRYNSFYKHFKERLQEISDKEVKSSITKIEKKLLDNEGYLKDLEKLRDHLIEYNVPDLESLREDDYSVIIQQLKEYITKIEDSKKIDKHSAGHCLTSPPSDAAPSTVIGREKDLEKLRERLSEKKHVMLSGLGGIGKTKLAQLLFHNYRDRFDEVAWIGYKGSLRQSFQYRIEDYQDRNDPWEAMMNDLHNDGKTKLFIIDNVDDDTDQRPLSDKDLRNLTGWENTAILLTSRLKEDLRPYSRYELKALDKDDCIAVFNHYYGSEADPEWVDKIVALAHYHTFTIELLAKGAKRENLAAYYKKIKKGFDEVEREVPAEYDDENATIEWHLRCLFDIQKRPEADKKVLNGFAVLPANCECSLEEIGQWFGFENKDLDDLIQDGWLSYEEGKQAFSMHPLVRAIVRFDFVDDAQGHKKTIAPEGTTDKILEYYSEASFDIDDGYASLQRRIDIVESVINAVAQEETVMMASVLHRLGYGYNEMGDYDKALDYFGKALEIRESKLGKDHPDTATTYNNIAGVYWAKGDYDKALEFFGKALEIRESKLGKDHTDTATTYNDIATVYRFKADYDKALEYYEKAIRIKESKFGKDHPSTAITYDNIAAVYRFKTDYYKALEYYKKALDIRESKLGVNHLSTATTYNNIAVVYDDIGNYAKALEYYEKDREISEFKLGKDNPSTATTYHNIAGVYRAKDDYAEALNYYLKALEIRESKLGLNHPNTASTYNNIAVVYRAKGDYTKALEYFLKALRIWLKRDVNHPNAKTIFGNLFDCFQAANMEKDFGEWLKEQLNEKEWEAYLELKRL